jgi:murein DD-endopeptidase MepM/ murein hydrolase activator NlpD
MPLLDRVLPRRSPAIRAARLLAAPVLLAAAVQAALPAVAAAHPTSVAAPAAAALPWAARPTDGFLTSGFGPRGGEWHTGLDIGNYRGAPVYAATQGVVLDAGPVPGFGMWVRLLHPDGTTTVYGHIDQALVAPGQRVAAGQPIATVGNRGISTGPHLHFEVRDSAGTPTDPQVWLASRALPPY